MTDNNLAAVSAFITGAPPGELSDVVTDIKSLTSSQPRLLQSALPAFQKYNEEQFTTVKLPGGSQRVLVSPFNQLSGGRYYDVESSSSFEFDHETQTASAVQSHTIESTHKDLVNSLIKALSSHANEHYEGASYSVFPSSDDSSLAIVLVANKYSPNNYWNGRWRCVYKLEPSSNSLAGTLKIDVHYYEDGNVRLTTKKDVDVSVSGGGNAAEIIRQIALVEKKYQEELNRGFSTLSEDVFKGLRRQLPITRHKMEWEKHTGYRASRELLGHRQ